MTGPKPRRSGGKASPYDHSPAESEYLSDPPDAQALSAIRQTGRFLTPVAVAEMARMVRLGVPVPVAATATGAGRRPVHWAAKARKDRTEGREGGWEEGQSNELYYLEAIEQAQAAFEADMVACIQAAAVHDWRAAAWALERRASQRWHLQSRLEVTAKDGGKVEISTMSNEKLLSLARGLLPAENIRETLALPSGEPEDGVLVEKE